MKKYFYGEEISEYGIAHNRVDMRALGNVIGGIINNSVVEKTFQAGIGDWETVNGCLYECYDSEGECYTEDEAAERIEELESMIAEQEEILEKLEEEEPDDNGKKAAEAKAEILQCKKDIDSLENKVYGRDIYQYYIITNRAADVLISKTDQIVFYNEELDMYVWGITVFGNPWEIELTNIPITEEAV